MPHTGAVPALQSYSYVFGPLLVACLLGALVVVLRWSHTRGGSLVRPVATTGHPGQYGLLVPVDAPANLEEAAAVQARLHEIGVNSTLATTTSGLRVLVWPHQLDVARRVVRELHGPAI